MIFNGIPGTFGLQAGEDVRRSAFMMRHERSGFEPQWRKTMVTIWPIVTMENTPRSGAGRSGSPTRKD